jgi:hypothetical protein
MTPVEPFVAMSRSAPPVEPASRDAVADGRSEPLGVRIAAAVVLFTAVASIVWFCVEAMLTL